MQDASGGTLEGDPPRGVVPAGLPTRLLLGDRVLEFRPDRGGPVRLVRSWDELPLAPKPAGTESEKEQAPPK
jgi:hypothetical protein